MFLVILYFYPQFSSKLFDFLIILKPHANLIHEMYGTVNGDISTLEKHIIERLQDVPEDIGNLFSRLATRHLDIKFYPKLTNIYFKNGEYISKFIDYEQHAFLTFAQHYSITFILDPNITDVNKRKCLAGVPVEPPAVASSFPPAPLERRNLRRNQ